MSTIEDYAPQLRSEAAQTLTMVCSQLAGHDTHLMSMTAREAISTPYECEIIFLCMDELDGNDLIGKPISLRLASTAGYLQFSGVVTGFSFVGSQSTTDFTYKLIIAPTLKLLELSKQNQVYGTDSALTLPDLISGKITNSLSSQSTSHGQQLTINHSFSLIENYVARENIVQFDESDLNFLSRLCEQAGIFYFFDHDSSGSTLVFGDSNIAFRPATLMEGTSLPFRHDMGFDDTGSVTDFTCDWRPVAEKVYLRDYNDMTPSTQLLASTNVSGGTSGAVVEYGQDFETADEGNRLATVRAQEVRCRKQTFNGKSNSTALRAGTFFDLSGHPNGSMNGRYLVTSVVHEADVSDIVSGQSNRRYRNSFECIRFDVPFRPARVTPKPVLSGLFPATVDGGGNGERAEIDANGRYKVRHFYDESNSAAGSASRYVRKAEPYAGQNDTGMHFPLLKGTEVMMSYVNGDPDRPIIVGAMANPLRPNVVKQSNNTLNRIRSVSGSMFELSDGASPPPYVRLVQPDTPTAAWDQSSYLRLGTRSGSDEDAVTLSDVKVTGTAFDGSPIAITPQESVKSTQDKIDRGEAVSSEKRQTNQSQKTQEVKTKKTDRAGPASIGILASTSGDIQLHSKGAAYMKFEAGHSTVVSTNDSHYDVSTGALYATGRTKVSITAGADGAPADLELTAYNYIKQTAYGPLSEETWGDSRKTTHGNSVDHFYGNKFSWFVGATETWTISGEIAGKLSSSTTLFFGNVNTFKFSFDTSITILGSANLLLGGKLDFVIGLDTKFVVGLSYKNVLAGCDTSNITSGVKIVSAADTKIVTGNDQKFVGANDSKFVLGISASIVNQKLDKAFNTVAYVDLDTTIQSLNIENKKLRASVTNIDNISTLLHVIT